MPSPIPASTAARWASPSWMSMSHCSQQWKSTRSASSSRSWATASVPGPEACAGQLRRGHAVELAQRAPGGPVDEALALADLERLERGLPGRRAADREHPLQGGLLGLPDQVAVDEDVVAVELAQLLGVPLDDGAVGRGQVRGLADVLHAQVQRVDEAAGGGQVRAGLDRRRPGRSACSGLSRTKPAPCSRADQLATSARSARSPKAQESSERTWNSMVMKPHCRCSASAAGSSQPGRGDDERAGVLARAGCAAGRGRCWSGAARASRAGGRPAGRRRPRRAARRRPRAAGGRRRHLLRGGAGRPPPATRSARRTSRRARGPRRWPRALADHGDRGHGPPPGAQLGVEQRAAARASSVEASTCRAARTARTVLRGTVTCPPCQSQYSVATP